jgi:peroxiredoxin (alkyl hydroperoxide reductase subunit C)
VEPTARALRVGDAVPDFELKTYDPTKNAFGKVSLAAQKAAGRWTVLFFYPADFTFV